MPAENKPFRIRPSPLREMSTETVRRRVDQSADLTAFEQIYSFQSENELWAEQMSLLLESRGITVNRFAELMRDCTGAAYNTARKWAVSLPGGEKPGERRREAVKDIGLTLGITVDELNRMLDRYARCRPLYMLSIEDAVCYLYLKNQLPGINPGARMEVTRLCNDLAVWSRGGNTNRQEKKFSMRDPLSDGANTTVIASEIANLNDTSELAALLLRERDIFTRKNVTLMSYIDAQLRRRATTVSHLTEGTEFLYFNKVISEMRNSGKLPDRDDMILFGVICSMNTQDINDLLGCAGMEKLFPKHAAEAFVIFALEEYSEDPDPGNYLWTLSRALDARRRRPLDDTQIFRKLQAAYGGNDER